MECQNKIQGKEKKGWLTSMQAIAVFSLSTTTESMLRPRMVVTARPYLCAVGLQRSITRPLTAVEPDIRLTCWPTQNSGATNRRWAWPA